MAYVITNNCILDYGCVAVCPVDCIHGPVDVPNGDGTTHQQLVINPDECIDCAACQPACPSPDAIFVDINLPTRLKGARADNEAPFKSDSPPPIAVAPKK